MKYLHENGCPWNKIVCILAAYKGHLKILKYLHVNGCPWDKWVCVNAAKGGHLKILKYLHDNDCPWDVRACREAAYGGHLECLKYLHENGCPWDALTCKHAVEKGHLECVKYLLEHDCPMDVGIYEKCVNEYKTETWFQVYMYVKKGIIDENTLHIHHKVLRIQRAWHRYAYNPESKIGKQRMFHSMSENNDELKNIM